MADPLVIRVSLKDGVFEAFVLAKSKGRLEIESDPARDRLHDRLGS